jgi:DNA mismatch repair protein MutS2
MLKEEIVAKASEKNVRDNDEMRLLISKLETKAKELETRLSQVEAERDKYTGLNRELSEQMSTIDNLRDEIIAKANKEAKNLVAELTKSASRILAEARNLLTKEQPKLHEVIELKHQINELQGISLQNEEDAADAGPVKENDPVYVKSYEQFGTVLKKLKGDLFEVEVGNVRLKIAESDLKKVAHTPKNVSAETSKLDYSRVKAERKVNLSLDLRGERYEDAKELIERYLDDCQLQNIKQASIIHGYGTGVIRELVQKMLKENRNVESFRYGGQGEGGSGATIVTFK